MIRFIVYLITFLSGIYLSVAQQITARVIDAETKESIPFATIRIDDTDLITNDDGYFTLSGSNTEEGKLLEVSFIGYQSQSISVNDLKLKNNIITLQAVVYDIGAVYVSNVKPDPNQIMKQVNANLTKNYTKSDYQSMIFVRESNVFQPKKMEFEIKKSTGFSKSDLKEINKDIERMTSSITKNPPRHYTDKLLNLYRNKESDKISIKVDVLKAIQLKDENKATGIDELQERTENLFLKHLDTTKFYRIKSGLIGSRDTISFSKEFNDKKRAKKAAQNKDKAEAVFTNLNSAKTAINSFIAETSPLHKENFEFITQPDLYTYTYIEATYMGNDLVYVLEFKPKKRKANYVGRLYINDEDYAVLRADFKLGEGKKLESLNLKLLLGIKFANNLHTGTIIYKKNSFNTTYQLQYASIETGQYFYVHRPLKFIEITSGDKDVLKLDFIVEGSTIEKTEFLSISTKPLNQSEFKEIKEKEFYYQTLKKYDPSVWKGYNIIEPVSEMKKFEVVE